jgi:hypothetical protein
MFCYHSHIRGVLGEVYSSDKVPLTSDLLHSMWYNTQGCIFQSFFYHYEQGVCLAFLAEGLSAEGIQIPSPLFSLASLYHSTQVARGNFSLAHSRDWDLNGFDW